MLSLDDARQHLLQLPSPPAGQYSAQLSAQLVGTVLAEDLHAANAHPNAARSRMDGYAVRAADTDAALPVASTARPADVAGELAPRTAWRIYTGAPLPEGADAVVMQEDTETQDDGTVWLPAATAGSYVRPAGEDFAAGQQLIAAGTQLHERHLALAAAGGAQELSLYIPPRIGLLMLGSELAAPGTSLAPGQQTDYNSLLLVGFAAQLGLQLMNFGTVRDDADSLQATLQQCCERCDLLITTGGASVGDEDFLPQALARSGEILFHRIAMRPGMPCIAGRFGECPVVGLPGNPVSAFTALRVLLLPCLRRAQGVADVHDQHSRFATRRAQLETVAANPLADRCLLLQARYRRSDTAEGQISVRPEPHQHSALLSPLVRANCLLELAAEQSLSAGDTVRIWPY